jgi:MSHA biogenesis protein MshP
MNLSNRFQKGFSLVGTVFIITVLAALAAFLVTITGTEQAAATYSLQGASAYAAAQSGIEWAARQALVAGSCVGSTTITPALGAPGNFTLTVTCNTTSVTEGAKTYNVYNLTSTATTGSAATANLVTRVIQASVTNG